MKTLLFTRRTLRSWGALLATTFTLSLPSRVLSALPAVAPTNDIRDIRGVVPVPTSWKGLAWTAAALGLAAAIVAFVRWRRRPKPTPPPPPHEIALARLAAAEPLIAERRPREFGIAVSDAVREYIEARFQLLAARRTTEEFLAAHLADDGSPLRPFRDPLGAFLASCDLAKFARWALDESAMRDLAASARTFVEATRPDRPAEPPSACATSSPDAAPAPSPAPSAPR